MTVADRIEEVLVSRDGGDSPQEPARAGKITVDIEDMGRTLTFRMSLAGGVAQVEGHDDVEFELCAGVPNGEPYITIDDVTYRIPLASLLNSVLNFHFAKDKENEDGI
jgi:hypothetical protein